MTSPAIRVLRSRKSSPSRETGITASVASCAQVSGEEGIGISRSGKFVTLRGEQKNAQTMHLDYIVAHLSKIPLAASMHDDIARIAPQQTGTMIIRVERNKRFKLFGA